MYRLYQKKELTFSLVWIIGYVVLSCVADSVSDLLGIYKIITAPVTVVFALLLYGFIQKHNLNKEVGLRTFTENKKDYLYFVPLLFIMSINLLNGVAMNCSVLETAMYILSMLCVGFIEEVIFRGFLFKALSKDNIKWAIFISSVTFGLGHIVNLLNGSDLIPTLLQLLHATAIGFLFTIIFYKSKSLWPCIITHSVLNSLSAFNANRSSLTSRIIASTILCALSIGYAMWILRKSKSPTKLFDDNDVSENTESHKGIIDGKK